MKRQFISDVVNYLDAQFLINESFPNARANMIWRFLLQEVNYTVQNALKEWRKDAGNQSKKSKVIKLLFDKASADKAFAADLRSVFSIIPLSGNRERLAMPSKGISKSVLKGAFRGAKKGSAGGYSRSSAKRSAPKKRSHSVKPTAKKPITFRRTADTGFKSFSPIHGSPAAKKAVKKKAAKPIKKSVAKKALPPSKRFALRSKRGGIKKNGSPATPAKARDEKIKCYFRAFMNEEVLLKQPETVRLRISTKTIKEIKDKLHVAVETKVEKDVPMEIRISAVRDIKIVGEDTLTAQPLSEKPTQEFTFTVKAIHPGTCKLRIDVWQKQVPVCSLELEPKCVASITGKKLIEKKHLGTSPEPYPVDIIQLTISERTEGRKTRYEYVLDAPLLRIRQKYESDWVKTNISKYINDLYLEIENMYRKAGNDKDEFQNKLREQGAALFSELFPKDLQQALWDNQSKIKSIQVISSEPFIPWELLLVRNPDAKKGLSGKEKFLGELGLTRLLYGAFPSRDLSITKGKAKYVIPSYSDPDDFLMAAKKEEAYLQKKFGAVIVPSKLISIRSVLKPDQFDLLHFCCHGKANSKNISNSELLLEHENQSSSLSYLAIESGPDLTGKNGQPIIVLNACQVGRLGSKITTYGGFAGAFVRKGAGVFVGSHWSIADNAAYTFITAFYDALQAGDILSVATVKARKAASKKNDATWLAYVVYGDPFARLK